MPLHSNSPTRLHNIRSCPAYAFAPRVPCHTPPFPSTYSPSRGLSRQKKAKKCLGSATKPNRHVLSVTAKCIALTIIYMVGHHTNAHFKQTATRLASPGVRPCQPTTHITPLSPWRGVGGEAFTFWRGVGGEAFTFWRGLRGEALSTNNAYHSPLPLERGRGWGFHPLERGWGWGQ